MRTLSVASFSIALLVNSVVAGAADRDHATDLTGADSKTFKAHIGKRVSLRGRLGQGKQGATLLGAKSEGVTFYVVPEINAGGFSWPSAWSELIGQQVRVTAELKFRSFPRVQAPPDHQAPPDYYYMVIQRTQLQRLGTK